jgi:hypothetical protein
MRKRTTGVQGVRRRSTTAIVPADVLRDLVREEGMRLEGADKRELVEQETEMKKSDMDCAHETELE